MGKKKDVTYSVSFVSFFSVIQTSVAAQGKLSSFSIITGSCRTSVSKSSGSVNQRHNNKYFKAKFTEGKLNKLFVNYYYLDQNYTLTIAEIKSFIHRFSIFLSFKKFYELERDREKLINNTHTHTQRETERGRHNLFLVHSLDGFNSQD